MANKDGTPDESELMRAAVEAAREAARQRIRDAAAEGNRTAKKMKKGVERDERKAGKKKK